MNSMQPIETLSPEQVAVLLGISTRTLHRWRIKGIGPAFIRFADEGSTIRYPVPGLVHWLESQIDIRPIVSQLTAGPGLLTPVDQQPQPA